MLVPDRLGEREEVKDVELEGMVVDLFEENPVYEVPEAQERYLYKKRAGSSDTKTTSDEFN
jgi:hypothetical protein